MPTDALNSVPVTSWPPVTFTVRTFIDGWINATPTESDTSQVAWEPGCQSVDNTVLDSWSMVSLAVDSLRTLLCAWTRCIEK